uniref:Integrase catalytic domain-containing protein n=1 Tax=Chromera velia CCMP2878 TaxID=1169474 RepID=A0A0G4FN23_9ALVE|eukprot:Cvel_17878.t1-p1 / transcript=Cvel_17878.t1 / gene=Cvel_17878 / organism=Chromera_velia_CCMP2878 / gene_product=hypothetical protein / transcript_product=hypothetical protein / location=Cvel_scaffold1450:11885-14371(-) / protein_length=582 / sequence_SO=supercontig / SO=protein_coding / is_pseudo=false
MAFYGDDGALEKFRTFARPSCFRPAPPTKACPPEMQQGVHVTGKPPPRPAGSTSGQQHSPSVGGRPLPPRPHCSHPGHKAEHCLKQHFCPSCVRWGHKPGDCELAKDIFALLRAYGYPTRDMQGRPYGRSRQRGGALAGTNDSKDEESGDDASDSNPAAAAAGHMTSANVSSSSPPPFSFDGLGCLLDVGASGIETTWRSLRAGLQDLPALKAGISRRAVQRALLPCIRGGTCERVKPRHAGDGSRGSLEVTQPGLRVTCDLVMGLSGGYSLYIQDQHTGYLGVMVVEEKSSDAINAAYEMWTNSLEGDLTPQVMTDHGTEFQGKFGARLAEREAYNPFTPVGSHQSLGKNERSHREWLTILRGILHDRGLDKSHWRDFASLAATKYNRQPRGHSKKSPFERRWSAQPPSPPIAALCDLLQTTRRPSEGSSPFSVGSSVLYHHPDLPRAKLEPLYTPASVLQRVKEHVFRLRLPSGCPILAHRPCIRPNDSSQPELVFSVPLSELQQSPTPSASSSTSSVSEQQQQQQQPTESHPPEHPKFDINDFCKDELIIWKDANTNRCFLGSARAVDPSGEGRVKVQA